MSASVIPFGPLEAVMNERRRLREKAHREVEDELTVAARTIVLKDRDLAACRTLIRSIVFESAVALREPLLREAHRLAGTTLPPGVSA